MKTVKPSFSWKAYVFDINSNRLVVHDVLKYREKLVKHLKNKCTTKEDFIDKLFRDFMWQYWTRCEYEMAIYIEDNRVFVEPWVGCNNPKLHRVDVTDYLDFDWLQFAKFMIQVKGNKDHVAKIDVYDQLRFRFNELTDFCWEYKHKYQRNKKEIN